MFREFFENLCIFMYMYILNDFYLIGSLQSARQRGVRGTVRGVRGTVRGVRGMRGTQKI